MKVRGYCLGQFSEWEGARGRTLGTVCGCWFRDLAAYGIVFMG